VNRCQTILKDRNDNQERGFFQLSSIREKTLIDSQKIAAQIRELVLLILRKLSDLTKIFLNSRKKIVSDRCIVCGYNIFTPIISLKARKDIKIITCLRCGLTRLDPIPSKNFYKNYYVNEYNTKYKLPQPSLKGSARGFKIKEFIHHDINRIKGVFEIGCGSGNNLLAFRNLNQNIKIGGIDPSKNAVSMGIKNGLEIIMGFNDDLTQEILSEYNIIILSHVIEHFRNPYLELLKIKNNIKENTFLYIEIPDSGSPKKKKYLSKYWFRIPHIYYFNLRNFIALVNKSGFLVLKLENKNHVIRVLLKKHEDKTHLEIANLNDRKQLLIFRIHVIKSIIYQPKHYSERIINFFLKNE